MKTTIVNRNEIFSHTLHKGNLGRWFVFMALLSLSLCDGKRAVADVVKCTDSWTVLDGNWIQPKNWSNRRVPKPGSDVCLTDGVKKLFADTTLNQNATINTIQIGRNNGLVVSSGATLTLANGGSIDGRVSNEGTIESGGALQFGKTVLEGDGGKLVAGKGLPITFSGTAVRRNILDSRLGLIEFGNGAQMSALKLIGPFFSLTAGDVTLSDGLTFIANSGASLSIGQSSLLIAGDQELAGDGTISLEDADDSIITAVTGLKRVPDLTIAKGIAIKGAGKVGEGHLNIFNEGTISADENTESLVLDPGRGNKVLNLGILQAVKGGRLTARGDIDNQDEIFVDAKSRLRVQADKFTNDGILDVRGNARVSVGSNVNPKNAINYGTVAVENGGDLTFTTGYVQRFFDDSETIVNGSLDIREKGRRATAKIYAGKVEGTGTINGNMNILEGIVKPGNDKDSPANKHGLLPSGYTPGMLTIQGNYQQETAGTLAIEIDGTRFDTSQGIFDYSRLAISGDSSIAGHLAVSLGFTPQSTDAFTLLTSGGGLEGDFANALPLNGSNIGDLSADGYGFNVVYNWSDDGYGSVVLTNFEPTPTPEATNNEIHATAGANLFSIGLSRAKYRYQIPSAKILIRNFLFDLENGTIVHPSRPFATP